MTGSIACNSTKSNYMKSVTACNTDYLFFEVHSDANFVALEPRESTNQDAMARPIIFMGNLTASNCARQGILVA